MEEKKRKKDQMYKQKEGERKKDKMYKQTNCKRKKGISNVYKQKQKSQICKRKKERKKEKGLSPQKSLSTVTKKVAAVSKMSFWFNNGSVN